MRSRYQVTKRQIIRKDKRNACTYCKSDIVRDNLIFANQLHREKIRIFCVSIPHDFDVIFFIKRKVELVSKPLEIIYRTNFGAKSFPVFVPKLSIHLKKYPPCTYYTPLCLLPPLYLVNFHKETENLYVSF